MTDERSDLEHAEQLFRFLQGDLPQDMRMESKLIPKLSEDVAYSVLYYLSGWHKDWRVPDNIRRCDVCGALYDEEEGGTCLDFADPPYSFCNDCEDGREYQDKLREAAECMEMESHRRRAARVRLLEFATAAEENADGLTAPQLMARLRLIVHETLAENRNE